MGFRFSKRIKIIPGLSLNLSRRGLSLTAGLRGASVNLSPRGTYMNLGLPGTGISYRKKISSRKQRPVKVQRNPAYISPVQPQPDHDTWVLQQTDELLERWMPFTMVVPDLVAFESALQRFPFIPSEYTAAPPEIIRLKSEWEAAETARIEQLKKLLSGDPSEYQELALKVVSSFNFPFLTSCEIDFDDVQSICLVIDLPEIEDIVPSINSELRKRMGISAPAHPGVRGKQYRSLVLREIFFIAGELFCYLPRTEQIEVAAYTQRMVSAEMKDCFLVDATIRRSELARAIQVDNRGTPSVSAFSMRLRPDTTWGLSEIEKPAWYSQEPAAA